MTLWAVQGHWTEFSKIHERMNLTTSTLLSMASLDDSELQNLGNELRSLIYVEQDNALELMRAVYRKETFNKDAISKRMHEFNGKTGTISGNIQRKLDKLAEKI